MRTYRIAIEGKTPLLMHADDVAWADEMDAWKNDKDNKKLSKAGDDRTPAHRWLGCVYWGGTHGHDIVMPVNNIMKSLMEAGGSVLVPGGQRGKTFKAQTQSGIIPAETGWVLHLDGRPVNGPAIRKLKSEKDFAKHEQAARDNGFELFVKRAKIGTSKHIRVRPMFHKWSIAGELHVSDEQITTEVLDDIFEVAGKYKGLGDWRPSSGRPGVYGMFSAQIDEV